MAANSNNTSHARTDKPNQPIASFLQEARNLYVWCKDDATQLKSVGITLEMIEELPARMKACSEALADWNSYKNTTGEAKKQWKQLAPQAIKFRAELLRSMRYAFHKHPHLQAPLSAISEGTGYSDLIQDLNDIAVLGKNNKELLLKISFDLSLLDTAAQKSRELAELWAEAQAEKNRYSEFKKNRNKTFWKLHGLVTEIRKAGRYVFRKDESRYPGYSSVFWKNKYNRRTKSSKSQKPRDNGLASNSN